MCAEKGEAEGGRVREWRGREVLIQKKYKKIKTLKIQKKTIEIQRRVRLSEEMEGT